MSWSDDTDAEYKRHIEPFMNRAFGPQHRDDSGYSEGRSIEGSQHKVDIVRPMDPKNIQEFKDRGHEVKPDMGDWHLLVSHPGAESIKHPLGKSAAQVPSRLGEFFHGKEGMEKLRAQAAEARNNMGDQK